MHDALISLLQTCLGDRMSVTVCGGEPAHFATLLERMLALAENQYSLVLLSEAVPFSVPHPAVSLRRDGEMDATSFARAACRQDPDTLAIDHRALEAYPFLLQAKMTGHRLILHSLADAEAAHATFLSQVPAEISSHAGELHRNDLYLQLDGRGQVHEVWQAVPQLTRLGYLDGQAWREEQDITTWASSPAAPIEPTPVPLPSDWQSPSRPLLDELKEKLGPYRRTAWGPIFGPQGQSKFGGRPALATGESWPCCGECGARMLLLLEVDLSVSPLPLQKELGGEGRFQLFYCVASDCSVDEAWEPFQRNSLARVLRGLCQPATGDLVEGDRYPETLIASWAPLEEGPSWEERERLCPESRDWNGGWSEAIAEMQRSPERRDELWRVYESYFTEFGITLEQIPELASYLGTATGDKLLGWPWWSQAPSYPSCPDCGQPMRMLVQINNDGGGSAQPAQGSTFGQVFAGDGNGHVFHCHGHLTFAWACG